MTLRRKLGPQRVLTELAVRVSWKMARTDDSVIHCKLHCSSKSGLRALDRHWPAAVITTTRLTCNSAGLPHSQDKLCDKLATLLKTHCEPKFLAMFHFYHQNQRLENSITTFITSVPFSSWEFLLQRAKLKKGCFWEGKMSEGSYQIKYSQWYKHGLLKV